MRFRKLAIGVGAVVAILLAAIVILPFAFRGRIEARLKSEIDQAVNARVAWGGVGLSLIRDFPNASLGVERLSIVGNAPFAGDTLLAMGNARLVLDLGSVVRFLMGGETIVVRDIVLDRPAANLRVLPDGRANWDIVRATEPAKTDTGRAIGVTLRNLQVSDGRLRLDDQQSHLDATIVGLDESLRGDFGKDRFVLGTHTTADTVSVQFAGVPYLSKVRFQLDADIDADMKAQRFTFARDTLRINALALAFAGSVTTGKPNVALDLTFQAPGTAFHDILSLVPAVYAHDFAQVQTTGTMAVSGTVKGAYGPNAFPSLSVRARVENGTFKYPSLPLPARDIFLALAVDNPGGHVDSTVVTIDRFHAAIGGRPVEARLVMRTPVSDPAVDFAMRGAVDLADVGRTVKLENVRELAGVVAADVAMRARVSDVGTGRYDRIDARGTVNVAKVALRSTTLPQAIAVDTAELRLTPRTAELHSFAAKIGKSDVRATGSLDNLLGFVLHDEDLRGSATVSSTQFDLNEWRSDEKITEVIPVPAHVDFALKASADRVLYGPLTLANVQGGVRVKDQRATLDELSMEMLRGKVIANGFYDTSVLDHPTFDVGLRLATVDIPTAFATLVTVQKLAPIARWAQGGVSGTVTMRGALDKTMTPVFNALGGQGDVETERLVVQGLPVLEKLADALSLDALRKPALQALRATFSFADGRVNVKPFAVNVAGTELGVSGSHGIDQTMKYDLTLAVPRSLLGGSAGNAVARLVSRAGRPAADLASGEAAKLTAQVTGTITNPNVSVNFAGMAASAKEAVQTAVKQEVETRTAEVKAKADSAAEDARRRAREEADRIVAEAEKQAATIRADARTVADKAKREANARADSLLAKATNPAAKIAAKVATDRLRKEADQQADRGVREADARADSLVARAKRQADALVPPKPKRDSTTSS